MQERPEEVPTGELPQNMTLVVDRHLVGEISPGTRVTVIGIYSIYQVCFQVPLSAFCTSRAVGLLLQLPSMANQSILMMTDQLLMTRHVCACCTKARGKLKAGHTEPVRSLKVA